MILSKSPLRISFAGGSTDIPSFYKKHNGAVLSTTINKYVYVGASIEMDEVYLTNYLNKHFGKEFNSDYQNPIDKEVLAYFNNINISIKSYSDISGRSGLGSSAAYTAALISTLLKFSNQNYTKEYLAQLTTTIEIDKLKMPVGKQDQYATVYGGFNIIEFFKDDSVKVNPLHFDDDTIHTLESNLFLIDTNIRRDASIILASLNDSILENSFVVKNLLELKDLVFYLYDAINSKEFDKVGEILHKGWMKKKTLTVNTSNSAIDDLYSKSIKAGATGGKILGAGGGGFLCLYVPQRNQKEFLIEMSNHKIIDFSFENLGTTLITKDIQINETSSIY